MEVNDVLKTFDVVKEKRLFGRYLQLDNILPLLKELETYYTVEVRGYSENNLPMHLIKLGAGSKKLLFWSQMHGNESTTTKAVFDLLNLFKNTNDAFVKQVLKECTLYIIPMLNPDGSLLYTRANYNKVDLNRDAQDRTQEESKVFKQIVDEVKPLVAFNLHGQRTIFSAGETNNSAIVSFLSPASDTQRSVTNDRKKGMRIIAEMNKNLQQLIPNCVGRYDDGFNINCTGDTMQDSGYPTILFEAGHHPGDYDREVTRKWMFLSMLTAINFITKEKELPTEGYEKYFDIPENGKLFNDIILRNITIKGENKDVAIQYVEELAHNKLNFIPKVVEIASGIKKFGHVEFDAKNSHIEISNVCLLYTSPSPRDRG